MSVPRDHNEISFVWHRYTVSRVIIERWVIGCISEMGLRTKKFCSSDTSKNSILVILRPFGIPWGSLRTPQGGKVVMSFLKWWKWPNVAPNCSTACGPIWLKFYHFIGRGYGYEWFKFCWGRPRYAGVAAKNLTKINDFCRFSSGLPDGTASSRTPVGQFGWNFSILSDEGMAMDDSRKQQNIRKIQTCLWCLHEAIRFSLPFAHLFILHHTVS